MLASNSEHCWELLRPLRYLKEKQGQNLCVRYMHVNRLKPWLTAPGAQQEITGI